MSDPSPQVGLPNYEWIEIQNNSTQPVQLQNWKLADAGSLSGPMPSYLLLPDSVLIICGTTAVSIMRNYGSAMGISSFPSLDNAGETLVLQAPNGIPVHTVSYETSWYRSALKQEGGWTLEMINTTEPCAGKENWTASNNVLGGTPGKVNAVNNSAHLTTAPKLINSFTKDSMRLILIFDKTLDSASTVLPIHYFFQQGGYSVKGIRIEAPRFCSVELLLNAPLQTDSVIVMEAKDLRSCTGKLIAPETIQTGRASDPLNGDWVINEILFNPRSSGVDFLECYNKSKKIIDLSQLFVSSRKSDGTIGTVAQLSHEPKLVFPREYYCFTEDPNALTREYLVANTKTVLLHESLPSFPDTEGTVLLLDRQGAILDELHYYDDWHFPLLDNKEGVSLERIRADGKTQDAGNWHSAATTEGYATPGKKNSQQREDDLSLQSYKVSPRIFSPDMDGINDVCTLSYTLSEQGQVANVSIINPDGRLIRALVPKATLSLKGQWNWDGLDDKGRAVSPGIYLFFVQQFGLNGRVRHYRIPTIIARSLDSN